MRNQRHAERAGARPDWSSEPALPVEDRGFGERLGLACDGSRTLTVTGGLPFFGGPGNNYGLHALGALMDRLRQQPGQRALVTGIGGMLNKHAAAGDRFVACTAGDDTATAQTGVADACDHATVTVASGENGKLLFRLR